MELTQYVTHFCEEPHPMERQRSVRASISRKLLQFPDEMPRPSAIVRNFTTPRTAFLRMFDKYLSDRAEWKLRLSAETRPKILDIFRRLSAESKFVNSVSGSHSIKVLEEMRSLPQGSETFMLDPEVLPPVIPVGITGIGGDIHHNRKNVMSNIEEAVDLLMKDVIRCLESSFKSYQQTEVIHIYPHHAPLLQFKLASDHSYSRNSRRG